MSHAAYSSPLGSTSGGSNSASRSTGRGDVSASAAAGTVSPAGAPALPPVGSEGDRVWRSDSTVRVITIVSKGAESPFGVPWDSVVSHISRRLSWTDTTYQMLTFYDTELETGGGAASAAFLKALSTGAQMVVGVDVQTVSRLMAAGCGCHDVLEPNITCEVLLVSPS